MATTTTNIKINIVEPGSSTPVDPTVSTTTTTDISTPDTGLFTHGIGGTEATIIGSALFLVLSSIIATILYKKHIRQGIVTKLVHIINQCKTVFTSKKRITTSLSVLALLASIGTLATLLASSNKTNTSALGGGTELTVDVDSEELTIEVGDTPVFAYLPVKLTVEEATVAGYTLTAYADSTDIVSTTDPDNVIPMVTLPEPIEPNEEGVGKGWSPVATLTDNTWGLSLEQPQDQNSEVYTALSIDQDNPTILKTIDDYTETEENDTTTIYYGFYITPDTPKGIYESSNINYSAVPNYITTLSFSGNGNDGGEDMDTVIIPAGNTITLPENTYTKEGYHFTGWNTDAEGAGESYADEAEYAAIAGESASVTLYAQWEEDGPTIEDLTYMQDFKTLSEKDKATVLKSMVEDEQYQLIDSRDSKIYYISKLKDGNVWMTQNLDLDLNNQTTLTPENTNISTNWAPTNNTISFTGTTVSGWGNSNTAPYSADSGDIYYYTSGTTDNDEQFTSLEACQVAHPDCSAHNHVGNYYSWSAAVASNSTSGLNTTYGDAPDSICPAGWKIPTGKQNDDSSLVNNELGNLLDSYNILGESHSCGDSCVYFDYADGSFNKVRTAPLWLVRAGYIQYAEWIGGGFFGYSGYGVELWSSTIDSSDYAYGLNLYSSYAYPANTAQNRNWGYSIRCLAE